MQNEDSVTFIDFKRRLRIYEELEKLKRTASTDNVMKAHMRQRRGPNKLYANNRKDEDTRVTCCKCGIKGHKARKTRWRQNSCSQTRPSSQNQTLRKWKASGHYKDERHHGRRRNNIIKFKSFDSSFQPDTHSVGLADGEKSAAEWRDKKEWQWSALDKATEYSYWTHCTCLLTHTTFSQEKGNKWRSSNHFQMRVTWLPKSSSRLQPTVC